MKRSVPSLRGISRRDLDDLAARHAVASLEAGANVRRGMTVTRAALTGVAPAFFLKKVKGDVYVVFTVGGAAVREVRAHARDERRLRAWVAKFNQAALS